jgi:hypothetical protein
MSNSLLPEVANFVVAFLGAAGGLAGAIAAFRSAGSARDAARSVEEISRRAALREVSAAASNVLLEAERVRLRCVELDTQYQAATVFSGSAEHTGYRELRENAAASATTAATFASDAALFTGGAKSLAQAPPDEVDRVLIRLSEGLATVRALRDELDRKHAEVSNANAAERERRLAAKYAR